jgi:hypothetical protein
MANFNNNIMSFSGAIQHKRGTAASLAASDYVPAAGEILVATDTGQVKPGDGTHTWSELPSFGGVDIADSYAETVAGKALDATKGKDLNDRVAVLEGVSGIDCGEISAPTQNDPDPGQGEGN